MNCEMGTVGLGGSGDGVGTGSGRSRGLSGGQSYLLSGYLCKSETNTTVIILFYIRVFSIDMTYLICQITTR